MATFKFAKSDIEDDLTKCSICLEDFTDPKCLPCLHTFCRSCLKSYLSSLKEVKSGFHCAVCRTFVSTKSSVPQEIVKDIPVNHFIVSLLYKKQIMENTKMCDPCGKRAKQSNASHWCSDCCEALCGECSISHLSMKALSWHQLLPVNELKNKHLSIPTYHDNCNIHQGKKLEIYCFDHEIPCCLTCMTVHHRKCEKVTTIDEAAKGIRENPDTLKLLQDFENMTVECERVIVERSKNLKSLDQEKEKIKISISAARENIDKHLDIKEKELREQLDASHKEHTLCLEEQKASYENTMKMTKHYRNVLSSCIQSLPETQALVEINKLRNGKLKCEEAMKKDDAKLMDVNLEFAFHKNIEQFKTNFSSFGRIHVNKTSSRKSSPNLEDRMFDVNSSVSLMENVKGQKTCITGGTCLPDERLALADYYLKRLLIYDMKVTRKAIILLSNNPWDVTLLDADKVAVTIPNEQCIQIFNIKTMCLEKKVTIGKNCYGIEYTNGLFVVACGYEVVKVDIAGTIIQTVSLGFHDVWYITSFGNDMFYTSKESSSIHGIEENGRELFSYRDRELSKPAGIQLDNQGNIYVAARGSCSIFQFDPFGKLIRILFQNVNLNYPQFILFSDDYTKCFIIHDKHSKYTTYGGTDVSVVGTKKK